MPDLEGAGPDAPITTNEHGGSQSHIPYRFDLIDGPALAEMAKVLSQGAEKYGENNWRKIPDVEVHLNHLLMHAYAWLSGDRQDDHLSHIMCRAMFAQAVDLSDNQVPKDDIDKMYRLGIEEVRRASGRS
jgi:hypothetical protein